MLCFVSNLTSSLYKKPKLEELSHLHALPTPNLKHFSVLRTLLYNYLYLSLVALPLYLVGWHTIRYEALLIQKDRLKQFRKKSLPLSRSLTWLKSLCCSLYKAFRNNCSLTFLVNKGVLLYNSYAFALILWLPWSYW